MKQNLKEVYNYNNYDLEESDWRNYKGHNATYPIDTHRAFMTKLAYFMEDQIRGLDSTLAALRAEYAARVAANSEVNMDLNEDLQWAIADQRDAGEKSLDRLAFNELEQYDELMESEYLMLQDARAAAEEGMRLGFEAARKNVIYNMHILRYAGGADLGSFGFGFYPSSFYGKGNSLTGVDTLDLFRLPNTHGYAQVESGPKGHINNDDDQSAKAEAALAAAKEEFADMIAACRADFGATVAAEKAASTAAMDAVNKTVGDASAAALAAQDSLTDASAASLLANKLAMKDDLAALTGARVDAFIARVDALEDETSAWIQDKLDWVALLDTDWYAAQLTKELNDRQAAIAEALEKRRAQSRADAAAAMASLCDNLDAQEAELAGYIAAMQAGMHAHSAALLADTAAAAAVINDRFHGRADAELAAKNATADGIVQDFAYWLKYLYGYTGFETSIYHDYDDTINYGAGDSLNYTHADGAYLDLGYQGAAGNEGGYPHISGFGYGGQGGHDYLYSGDQTGKAYGKFIGPDPAFYDGTLLGGYEHEHYAGLEGAF